MINGPARAAPRHRVRLLVPRPQRPRQRHHRPRAAPGDAQRRRLDSRRGEQVGLRPAGPRIALLRRVGGEEPVGAVSRAPRLSRRRRASITAHLRDRHAGHRRHLRRDRRGADLGAGALDRLDRQQQGAGAAGRRATCCSCSAPTSPTRSRATASSIPRRCSGCCSSGRARRIERWHRKHWPKLEKLGYVDGNVVPLAADPEQFLIAVAGGESGHHALYFCTFGLTWSVSDAVRGRRRCWRRRGVRAPSPSDALLTGVGARPAVSVRPFGLHRGPQLPYAPP